jgi:hypothetical protein
MNTRENFKTDAQYERWLEYKVFFEYLIELQNKGITIWANDEPCGKFMISSDYWGNIPDGESHLVEKLSSNSFVCWVGAEHDYNKKTGNCDFLYISQSLNYLKKQHKFRYYQNEVIL